MDFAGYDVKVQWTAPIGPLRSGQEAIVRVRS
jgi:hypothetical protein